MGGECAGKTPWVLNRPLPKETNNYNMKQHNIKASYHLYHLIRTNWHSSPLQLVMLVGLSPSAEMFAGAAVTNSVDQDRHFTGHFTRSLPFGWGSMQSLLAGEPG